MLLAASFVSLYAVSLTIAPAVRMRTWSVSLDWDHWLGFLIWGLGFFLVFRQQNRHAPSADPFLIPLAALLTGWGLMTISRLSAFMGARQSIWLGVGLLLFWFALRMKSVLPNLRRYKYIWLTAGLLLTALTLLFGTYPGGEGPRLWLGCCGIYLQPSEPLKLLLIIYLAALLADRIPFSFSLFGMLAPSLLLVGIAIAIMIVQRDLGTTALMILIYSMTLFLASGHKRMLLFTIATLLLAGLIGYRFSDVVQARMDAFLYPWRDPSGSSYQIVQSLLAIASGGVIGRGPGLGSPGVVPVAISDFIYPAIVEETGLLGAAGLLLAFALLIVRGLVIALYAPYRFQRYLAAGISAYFACQVILIIGGNIRLLPLTGVTLPLISYGGSSLLTALASILILLYISQQSEEGAASLQQPFPFTFFFGAVGVGISLLLFVTGWYGIVRQESLLNRMDNPRRSISERYVLRGDIIDRNNQPISISVGSPGTYQRMSLYQPLSLTSGYSNAAYGQSGIEASQDGYLRGMQGMPSFSIWWNRLLYGEPPPGLDVRLTIDLDLQKVADQELSGHNGAAILLNAQTGEILAMASYPFFDPNRLDEDWDALITDPDSPLLNRATQGLYPPGAAIAPLILSEALAAGDLPDMPNRLTYALTPDKLLECALPPSDPSSWSSILSSGCPAPLALLGNRFLPANLENLLRRFHLAEAPSIPLEAAAGVVPTVEDANLTSIGENGLLLSPLHMALVAATISAEGIMPSPILPMAVNTPHQGWIVIADFQGEQIVTAPSAQQVSELLAQPGRLYWQVTAVAGNAPQGVSWFIAGTIQQWNGAPLALAVVVEEDNPELAKTIGEKLLGAALNTN